MAKAQVSKRQRDESSVPVREMTVDDLVQFLKSAYRIDQGTLEVLHQGNVDGEALLLLDPKLDSVCDLGLNKGPAIKLLHAVKRLQGDGEQSQPAHKKSMQAPASPSSDRILTFYSDQACRYNAQIPGAP